MLLEILLRYQICPGVCHARLKFRTPERQPRHVPGLRRRAPVRERTPRRSAGAGPAAHYRRGRSRTPVRALPASVRILRDRSSARGSARRRTAAAFRVLGDRPTPWRSTRAHDGRRPAALDGLDHHAPGVPRSGVGVLPLTIVPGYVASRMTSAHATPHVMHARNGQQQERESAPSSADVDAVIRAVAARYGVSVELIAAIIEAESEFNPRAVSRTGARGLMQLMPQTAAILGVGDPFDPRENIEAGVKHLSSLMDRFEGDLPLVLAAYNAGERAVIGHP